MKQNVHPVRKITTKMISLFFISLFVYSAASILLDNKNFVAQIVRFPLMGSHARTLGWLIPSVEFLMAALLLFPVTRITGLIFSLLLAIVYTAYTDGLLRNYPAIPFSNPYFLCKLSPEPHLLVDCFFIGVALIGVCMQLKQLEIDGAGKENRR